eukprot:1200801-Amorphochlora_amoeboformis.AAC.1
MLVPDDTSGYPFGISTPETRMPRSLSISSAPVEAEGTSDRRESVKSARKSLVVGKRLAELQRAMRAFKNNP